MNKISACCVLAVLILATPSIFAVCGDVNASGGLPNLADISALVNFLFIDATLAAPADADLDDMAGISIADLNHLTDHLFGTFPPLDCVIDNCYDFGISLEDTVILPMAQCVDFSLNNLALPVETRLGPNTTSLYLPIDPVGSGSNGCFSFVNATLTGPTGSVGQAATGTIAVVGGVEPGNYVGTNTFFELNYTRTAPGYGTVTTGPTDIDWDRRFVIQHTDPITGERDLFRPVIEYCWVYDYPDGDIDCNCMRDMGDLTIMIDGLFISLTWPPSCPHLPF